MRSDGNWSSSRNRSGNDNPLEPEPRGTDVQVINKKIEPAADISKLFPHPQNPRNGDTDAIGQSIDNHGFYGVIVAQESTGRILAGNHRYFVAMERGEKTIPVAWVDVDDDTALEILLDDNRASDLGKQDDAILADALRALAESDHGLDGVLYDADFLDALPVAGEAVTIGENLHNTITEHFDYHIVFERGEDLDRFLRLVPSLRQKYPELNTNGERFARLADDLIGDAQ